MAAAARPGPTDARVPCPLCGGLIHPIAGKCKHCKADLTAMRAARPAANAALPALNPAGPVNGQTHGPVHGQAQAHAQAHGQAHSQVHAPVAHAAPPLHEVSQPVLPPRPTARVAAAPSGTWRSWPVVVIVVAMMAILAAVVLMVWPAHRDRDGKRLPPPPAPERMDTQIPATPHAAPSTPPGPSANPGAAPHDPWAPPATDPPQHPGAAQADPDDGTGGAGSAGSADSDDDASGPIRGQRLSLNTGGQVAVAVTARLCLKLAQCGDAANQAACAKVLRLPSNPPTSCPAFRRCLREIDMLDCMPDLMQTGLQLMQLGDCADAVHC